MLLVYLSFTIIWANNEASNEVCQKISVKINNEDDVTFLTKEGIIKELENAGINPIGKKTALINTDSIEKILDRFDYLEDAECVIVNNNTLSIEVNEMVPIMRVFSPRGSYYVNRSGKRIKADSRYHLDVPVVNANFPYRDFTEVDLIPLIDYIKENDVLESYITAINVKDRNNIFIVPNIQGHVINIGDVNNLENKFAKISRIYQEVIPVKGWWNYDTISVKWDYQIVATRRTKAIPKEEEYNPEEDEEAPDLGTITVDDTPPIANATPEPLKKEIKETPAEEKPKKQETKKETGNDKKETKEKKDNKDTKAKKETKEPTKTKEKSSDKKKSSKAQEVTKNAFKDKKNNDKKN